MLSRLQQPAPEYSRKIREFQEPMPQPRFFFFTNNFYSYRHHRHPNTICECVCGYLHQSNILFRFQIAIRIIGGTVFCPLNMRRNIRDYRAAEICRCANNHRSICEISIDYIRTWWKSICSNEHQLFISLNGHYSHI